ncbi:G-protein coupled receptor 3-like [Asterias rubens]|uniref:G-protein coupled receptor 3-like n=1 Tax=Asterias rubens TaxID=7604 RepID=UPI001455051C|nr:G-protein coupled receptor 3-like [Asterias rubens]
MILQDRNVSSNSTSNEVISVVCVCIWTITTVLTLFLNTVCLVLLQHVQGFNKSTLIFLKSMTVSDLLLGVFFYLPTIAVFAAGQTWPDHALGPIFCLIEAWVIRQGLPTSALSVLLVTIDRYIAIVYPLNYEVWLSPKRARLIVCTVWFTANMYALVSLLTTKNMEATYSDIFFICTIGEFNETKAAFTLVLLSVGIMICITIMYIRILIIANRHAAHIVTHRPSTCSRDGQVQPTTPTPNRKSFTTVTIITMTLVIGWMPSVIIALTNTKDTPPLVIIVTQVPLASVSWLNVIVYYVRNQAFKEAGHALLTRIFKYCKGCCRNKETEL